MRGIWIGVSLGVTLSIILVVALKHSIRQPRTYREAVIAVLDQRRIPYTDIELRAVCWTNPIDCTTPPAYVADVVVVGERPAYGQIVCQHGWDDCALTSKDLGLGVPPVLLPPLAQAPPWLADIERYIQTIGPWLRTLVRAF